MRVDISSPVLLSYGKVLHGSARMVQFYEIGLFPSCPADIGKVAIGGVAGIPGKWSFECPDYKYLRKPDG